MSARAWIAGRRLAPLALLLLAGTSLWAEDPYPLRAVVFEGTERFASDALVSAMGLELGQKVTKRDFDSGLQRLQRTGMFENLSYRFGPQGDGYRLVVTLRELPELFPVRFEGLGADSEALSDLLREALPLYAGVLPHGGPAVRAAVDALQGWWRSQGGEEEVVADLVPSSGNDLEMLIRPERMSTNIAFVRFKNAGDVDARELQRLFNLAAVGEPYSEARLKELLAYNARPLYTERGYMNVVFCPCETGPDPDSEGLLVDVHVEQGEVYRFGTITWPEPLPIDPDSLAKVNQIEAGYAANMKAAYDTMAAISEGMKRQGYMKAQATFEEFVDHDDLRVDLEVQIATGQQYVFSRLIIKGLDILSEPTVRKRWGMQPGAPFDIRYPAYFLDRVRADAMFENLKRTSWSPGIDEANGRVDVTLYFSGLADEPFRNDRDEIEQPFD